MLARARPILLLGLAIAAVSVACSDPTAPDASSPDDLEGLIAVAGMRQWKAEVVSKELLEVLRQSA